MVNCYIIHRRVAEDAKATDIFLSAERAERKKFILSRFHCSNLRMDLNELSSKIISACIEVHKALGPGLLESSYEECLCHELSLRGLSIERQKPLAVQYKGLVLECGYRLDVVVENEIILELKACEKIDPIHKAQLLTYLKLSGLNLGLLLNFNATVMKDGIVRIVDKLME